MSYQFELYIVGQGGNSLRALNNIKALLKTHLKQPYKLEVIDLSVSPEAAVVAGIRVVPTLVKTFPSPLCKLMGDLKDADRVLHSLGITPLVQPAPPKKGN